MNLDAVTLSDQSSHLSRVNLRILLLLLKSKLEHFALKLYRARAASLSRKEGTEPQLFETQLNLIEAFAAEAELAARLRDRISVNCMGAQHFVFDLSAIARVEEIHFEELRLNGFRMRVQRPRRKQGLLFRRSGHEEIINAGLRICQDINAHINIYGADVWDSVRYALTDRENPESAVSMVRK